MVVGARRIRSKKLREHQYREGYARSFEAVGVCMNGIHKHHYGFPGLYLQVDTFLLSTIE